MKIVKVHFGDVDKSYYLGFCPHQGKYVMLEQPLMATRFADSDYAGRVLEAIRYVLDYQFRRRMITAEYLDPIEEDGASPRDVSW